jgi:hypothetical protein
MFILPQSNICFQVQGGILLSFVFFQKFPVEQDKTNKMCKEGQRPADGIGHVKYRLCPELPEHRQDPDDAEQTGACK